MAEVSAVQIFDDEAAVVATNLQLFTALSKLEYWMAVGKWPFFSSLKQVTLWVNSYSDNPNVLMKRRLLTTLIDDYKTPSYFSLFTGI